MELIISIRDGVLNTGFLPSANTDWWGEGRVAIEEMQMSPRFTLWMDIERMLLLLATYTIGGRYSAKRLVSSKCHLKRDARRKWRFQWTKVADLPDLDRMPLRQLRGTMGVRQALSLGQSIEWKQNDNLNNNVRIAGAIS